MVSGMDKEIVAHDWPYRDADTALTGVLVRDQSAAGPQPGLLLVHGGAGLNEHARGQARRYARLGYVVFACDMLGDEVRGDRDRIINCLTSLRDDPAFMLRRAQAGLAILSDCPGVGARRAAVGFCFGGLVARRRLRPGGRPRVIRGREPLPGSGVREFGR